MPKTLGMRKTRRYAAALAALATATLGATAGAVAAPGSGSSGSSGFDTGSFGDGFGSAVPRSQQCNASTESGGAGVTDTVHELGRSGPASFVLSYETESIPDLIQVFYGGAQVYSTGYIGDNINEGTGSAVVTLPAGGATSVLVRVTGPSDTEWSYVVRCPA
ncbi:hypothetical protein [Nocardia sp. BMG51109]|uniref:hypothetical protein n=1 Tax=Nocardia sp. BMG51109 TaxID=1056816 RepID=UPI0004660B4F|nr:hypothetical protein [Nocardia sp. BMG51109]